VLSVSADITAKNALAYKTPVYLVHFDGETTDYVNHVPVSPSNTCKQYLIGISGSGSSVTPEEGRGSISSHQVEILDVNDEITALLATDGAYFHRKKVTIKAGYLGTTEADMASVFTGWVTGLSLSADGLSYLFAVTDPQRWMQRKVFRGAESSNVIVQGNPLTILLRILTSTGAGTNGDYDNLSESNGLGIDDDFIDVAGIEQVRDDYFPGNSHYMRFVIDERIRAKDFIETELLKPLNLYPVITGAGKFSVRPTKPPIAALSSVQSFSTDSVIGIPKWDANLDAMINEVEFSYQYSVVTGEFSTVAYYADSSSINARGPGKKVLEVKSRGLRSSISGASLNLYAADVVARRVAAVFGRWAVPPVKITVKTFFSRWLSEPGDIVPLTYPLLPDIVAGTRGLAATRLEIVDRTVDWKRGTCTFTMIDTGFAKGSYGAISPAMTVIAGASATQFTVSTTDAVKYSEYTLPEIQLRDANGRVKAASATLLTVDTSTGVCTCDDLGLTPSAGDVVTFANYDDCTAEQKLYSFIADATEKLGAADDAARLIVP